MRPTIATVLIVIAALGAPVTGQLGDIFPTIDLPTLALPTLDLPTISLPNPFEHTTSTTTRTPTTTTAKAQSTTLITKASSVASAALSTTSSTTRIASLSTILSSQTTSTSDSPSTSFSASSSSSSAVTSVSAASVVVTSPSTPTVSQAPQNPSNSAGGLSTVAKAGIGVGAVVLLGLIIASLVPTIRRCLQARKEEKLPKLDDDFFNPGRGMQDSTTHFTTPQVVEVKRKAVANSHTPGSVVDTPTSRNWGAGSGPGGWNRLPSGGTGTLSSPPTHPQAQELPG